MQSGQKKSIAQKLESLLLSESTENNFNGTIIVGNKDEIIFKKAIGIANRVWDIPFELNTKSNICSISKSFLAALTLIAVEERRLSLDDRVVDLIDSKIYKGKFHPAMTLHHLLTHTSGLTHYEADSVMAKDNFKMFKRQHFSRGGYIDYISQIKPKNNPGESFNYSSLGYFILAYVLEDEYQKPFSDLLNDKICTPLGLGDTFSPKASENVHRGIAEGYKINKTDQWVRNHFIDESLGRVVFSSSIDLYTWAKAMYDNNFLSSKSRNLMLTNHLTNITPLMSYGYGWAIFDGKGQYNFGNLEIKQPYIIHGGNTEGYKSMLVNINEGAYIIAFLTNTGEQINEMNLIKKITHILTK